jgi:hypothetical protein
VDDYATTGKPVMDWDDDMARETLVDSRAPEYCRATHGEAVPSFGNPE